MIVDASVAFKWIAEEHDSPAALDLIGREALAAPVLMLSEVANALWKKGRREQIDRTVSFAPEMGRLGELVTLVDESSYAGRALELARALDHPVYDCIYLAMAERLERRLVTADRRFLRALAATPYAHHAVALA